MSALPLNFAPSADTVQPTGKKNIASAAKSLPDDVRAVVEHQETSASQEKSFDDLLAEAQPSFVMPLTSDLNIVEQVGEDQFTSTNEPPMGATPLKPNDMLGVVDFPTSTPTSTSVQTSVAAHESQTEFTTDVPQPMQPSSQVVSNLEIEGDDALPRTSNIESTLVKPSSPSTKAADAALPVTQPAMAPSTNVISPETPIANSQIDTNVNVGAEAAQASEGRVSLASTEELATSKMPHGEVKRMPDQPSQVSTPVTNSQSFEVAELSTDANLEPSEPTPTAGVDNPAGTQRLRLDSTAYSIPSTSRANAVTNTVKSAVLIAVNQNDSRIRVDLDPPELGSVRIELAKNEQGVTARIVSEVESTSHLLQDNLSSLRKSLESSGIDIQDFDFQTASGDRNSPQRDQDDEAILDDHSQSGTENSVTAPESTTRVRQLSSSGAIDVMA